MIAHNFKQVKKNKVNVPVTFSGTWFLVNNVLCFMITFVHIQSYI